jgi:hypothetical protein
MVGEAIGQARDGVAEPDLRIDKETLTVFLERSLALVN